MMTLLPAAASRQLRRWRLSSRPRPSAVADVMAVGRYVPAAAKGTSAATAALEAGAEVTSAANKVLLVGGGCGCQSSCGLTLRPRVEDVAMAAAGPTAATKALVAAAMVAPMAIEAAAIKSAAAATCGGRGRRSNTLLRCVGGNLATSSSGQTSH